MPITVYDTKYVTVVNRVTRYLTTRYRVVTDIVTSLNIMYYDDEGNIYTVITHPTRYVKTVRTVLAEAGEEGVAGVRRATAATGGQQRDRARIPVMY